MERQLPVITISRQYAAYGSTIARKLSERLGIPLYDKDFQKRAALESGYGEDEVAREGEEISRGSMFLNTVLNNSAAYTSSHDEINRAQRKLILELAREHPCIIIGRCSDYTLKQAGIDVFRVFLHADLKSRKAHAKELGGYTGDVLKYIAHRDQLRENYCKQYTGHVMGDSRHYEISLDVGAIGIETCVDVLAKIITEKYGVNHEQ